MVQFIEASLCDNSACEGIILSLTLNVPIITQHHSNLYSDEYSNIRDWWLGHEIVH